MKLLEILLFENMPVPVTPEQAARKKVTVTLSVLNREAQKIQDPKINQFISMLNNDITRGNYKGAIEYVSMILRDNQQSLVRNGPSKTGLPDFTRPETKGLWDYVNMLTASIKGLLQVTPQK